jgi:FkbM family methyltransferase
VVPSAVGDDDGSCDFQVDTLTSNSGTLDAVTHGKPSQSHDQYGLPPATIQVKVCRLDTLVASGELPAPNVIKLDVEGAEAMALQGARNVLKTYSPYLDIELHGAQAARDVLEVLWSVGYHCFGYLYANGTRSYREILPADIPSITEMYSLHFLVASARADDLVQPIADFSLRA